MENWYVLVAKLWSLGLLMVAASLVSCEARRIERRAVMLPDEEPPSLERNVSVLLCLSFLGVAYELVMLFW